MKRSTLIVLGLFVLLLALALMLSKKPAQRGTRELDLSSIKAKELAAIEIQKAGEEKPVELAKKDGVWKLKDGHLADPDAVDRAVKAISEISTDDFISRSASRQEKYGVSKEKGLKISLRRSSGSPISLMLGSSDKGGAFIRREGEKEIFKLKRNISYLFPTESKRWLKLKLVDFKIEDLKGARIALAGVQAYELLPTEDEQVWKLADSSVLPEGFRFDGKAARALVQQAVSCRATEIVDEAPEGVETGFGEAEDRITLNGDGASVSLHLGAMTEKNLVWARVDGRDRLFRIPEYQAKNLRKKLEDLRDMRLMKIDPEKLSDLRIQSGKTSIHLVRGEQGDWSIDEKASRPPQDFNFDPAMVEGFISSLENLRAEKYFGAKAPAKTGFNHPLIRIELESAASPPIQLLVGREIKQKEGASLFYAQGNADDMIYGIPAFQKERLSRGWELFRKINRPPGGGMGNIDPATLAKLPPEVRQQLLQQMRQRQQMQQMQRRTQ